MMSWRHDSPRFVSSTSSVEGLIEPGSIAAAGDCGVLGAFMLKSGLFEWRVFGQIGRGRCELLLLN